MSRAAWISGTEWGVIVAVIALDCAFAAATGIGVRALWPYVETLTIVLALWPALAVLIRVTGFAEGGAFLAELAAKTLIFIYAATVLEYYLATSPAPLADGLLIRADRALGFDWPTVFAWCAAHPRLHLVLGLAYSSLLYETGAVVLALGLFFPERARRFTLALIVSTLFTIPFLWFLPVAGPFVAFDHTALPQADYTQHYLGMRDHTLAAIPLDEPRGIVSFPSYHAAAAVLLAYLLRGVPVLYPAALIVNTLMVLGTPVLGGHYLVDVLAGLAVGGATILVIERIAAARPVAALPLFRVSVPRH